VNSLIARTSTFASIAAISCALLSGQAARTRPSFEVASVRENLIDFPNDPRYTGLTDYVPRRSGDRISMRNSDLVSILSWAYHLTNANYELVAGRWEKNLWVAYDIEARAPGPPGDDDLRRMFQTLLEDRFNLKVHRETRELAAYDLVVLRGGPKLTLAPERPVKNSIGFGGSSCWIELAGGGSRLVGRGASMEELAVVLTGKMGAPVRDRTGITGSFDYGVAFSNGVDASDAPFLTTAVHELGLNLEKARGKFEVLVIDRLEKPSDN
jgi:uncharacterized protein (TIGR03435 family)